MDDAKWEKYGALGGVVFVVLNIIAGATSGEPPAPDDSDEKIVEWFTDHAGAIKASQFILGISAIFLVWWFASLFRRMAAAEGGRHRLSVVAAIGLALSGSVIMISGAVNSAVALRIDDSGAGAAQFFYTFSSVLVSTSGFGAVTLLLAVSALSFRTRMLPAWITYLGVLSALAFLVGTIGSASDAGAYMGIGFIGFILWGIWILGISFEMWKRPASAFESTVVAAMVVTVD